MRTAPSRVHSPATPNMRRTLSLRIFQQQRRLMATAMAAQPTSQPSPTSIPRAPGVKDGPWTALDSAAVEQALADARELAQRRHAPKHGPVLLATTPDEMHALVTRAVQHLGGEGADNAPVPAYRSKQLLDAILKGTRSMDDITTVPKTLRAALKAYGVRTGRSKVHHTVQASDGTCKFLLQLHDGYVVETVGIPDDARLTACVSSQVGCPMRCLFCATGKGGYARNLAPHEIVDQVLTVQEQAGRRVSNVVFMGQGEPLLNVPSVVCAVAAINKDLGIGARHITISTVGVRGAIAKLAQHKLQCTLAVSLHAPNQALRASIVPSAKAYPLNDLMRDCVSYFDVTGRRVTFEYTLLAGVNDGTHHAAELASLLRRFDLRGHVNLIPWNPVGESEYVRPSRNAVVRFQRVLEQGGVPVSVRITRGLEAAAACGQLRNDFQQQPLEGFAALE